MRVLPNKGLHAFDTCWFTNQLAIYAIQLTRQVQTKQVTTSLSASQAHSSELVS